MGVGLEEEKEMRAEEIRKDKRTQKKRKKK